MLRSKKYFRRSALAALALVIGLTISTSAPQAQSNGNPGVLPPNARPFGLTYPQWSGRILKWGMELPPDAGNPFIGCPNPPDAGQSGHVWFLPFLPPECDLTVPAGKMLLSAIAGYECSSLEDPTSGFHGDTAQEQRACAKFWTDHIVVSSLFYEIDGVPVQNLDRYRFVSPQFEFTAPTPWIFGNVGGIGTSVGDTYFVMLTPLPVGKHTIHFGGAVHFSVANGDPFDADFGFENTFHLTVVP